jgi:hypothetical protein
VNSTPAPRSEATNSSARAGRPVPKPCIKIGVPDSITTSAQSPVGQEFTWTIDFFPRGAQIAEEVEYASVFLLRAEQGSWQVFIRFNDAGTTKLADLTASMMEDSGPSAPQLLAETEIRSARPRNQQLHRLEDDASEISRIWNAEHDQYVIARLIETVRPSFLQGSAQSDEPHRGPESHPAGS